MITEYFVLNVLGGHHQAAVDEISPTTEWEDRYNTSKLIECLVEKKLVEIAHYNHDDNSGRVPVYVITTAGEYRLQQLRERQEGECKTAQLLDGLNEKLDAQSRKNELQAKSDKRWQVAGFTIGLLTLAATILFGILALLR